LNRGVNYDKGVCEVKVAVVYNRDSRNVINLFGMPNQEKIGLKTIRRIVDALKQGGHQAISLEGDKELIDRLEDFMPRVLKGENPGLVFNLSYGIQGQARYAHVPSILEMVGIPYVGSGPLAHSLALDKVVSKMIFQQNGIPTSDFAVLNDAKFEAPGLPYPLIVKPKNEAVSFGIRVVKNEKELREAAGVIFNRFKQPVLAERYIDGREINVGLIGNPPEPFAPAEIVFGKAGLKVYSYEDKTGRSGRKIVVQVPARLTPRQTGNAQAIATAAFNALGCHDCARVDLRMDGKGDFYVLEINSLPSLGEHGSYTNAADFAGLDYTALVNRLVDVASARYFGTPNPPIISPTDKADPSRRVFSWLTQRRDRIEKRLGEWIRVSSRTTDPVGLREARRRMDAFLKQLGMTHLEELSTEHSAATWVTRAGIDGGTLLIVHLDVPRSADALPEAYRRDPEWLFGEGVGASRAPIVMLEFALQALRSQKLLRKVPLAVLYYMDEGRDAVYSSKIIHRAAACARRVLVLRPGNEGERFIKQRRGQRKYKLVVEGRPRRPGHASKRPDTMLWFADRITRIAKLSSRGQKIAVAATNVRTSGSPMLLPHRLSADLLMSYLDAKRADEVEEAVRGILGKNTLKWKLELVSDRPAMKDRVANQRLAKAILNAAAVWEIDLRTDSSVWPSVGGLVTGQTGVVCGMGPVARNLYTPQESVHRMSLIQRTLLLVQFLLRMETN
jgi:D-alanine-D-alanine ligase